MINRSFIYPSIGLISAGMMAFMIFILRFFTYNQTSMNIFIPLSASLIGIAIAASVISIFDEKIKKKSDIYLGMSLSLAIFCTSLVFFLLKIFHINLIGYPKFSFFIHLIILYLLILLPFFFSGFFVVLVFHIEKNHLGPILSFKFIGAAIGSLVIITSIFFLHIKFIIFIILFLMSLGAVLIISKEKKYKVLSLLIILVSFLISFLKIEIGFSPQKDIMKVIKTGSSEKDYSKLIKYEKESSFGELFVLDKEYGDKLKIGISNQFSGSDPENMKIFVDGNEISYLVKGVDKKDNRTTFLDYTPYKVIYSIIPNAKTLILNSGGGLGVMAAIYFGVDKVHAVDKNYKIWNILKETESSFIGGAFHNLKSEYFRSEARSFAISTKDKKKYDVIEIMQRFSATNSFKEEPNYLLTIEAIKTYFQLLENNGILMIQTELQKEPRIEFSITATLKQFIKKEKLNPKDSFYIFKTPSTLVFFLKKGGFTFEENQIFKKEINLLNYKLVYPNDDFSNNVYSKYISSIMENKQAVYQNYKFKIKTLTDNKPYIAYNIKFKNLFSSSIPKDEVSNVILWITLLLLIIIGVVVAYLPLSTKKENFKNIQISKVIVFFAGIGIGVSLIIMALIQKFNILFSNITLSVSLVIISFFFFGGIGTYIAEKFKKKVIGLFFTLSIIIAVVIIYTLLFNPIFNFLISLKAMWRAIFSMIIFAPLSLLLGMPFALGLEWIKHFENKIVPWCWALRSVAAGLTIVIAFILSVIIGINWLMILSPLFFAISFGSFMLMDHQYKKTSYLYRKYKI